MIFISSNLPTKNSFTEKVSNIFLYNSHDARYKKYLKALTALSDSVAIKELPNFYDYPLYTFLDKIEHQYNGDIAKLLRDPQMAGFFLYCEDVACQLKTATKQYQELDSFALFGSPLFLKIVALQLQPTSLDILDVEAKTPWWQLKPDGTIVQPN